VTTPKAMFHGRTAATLVPHLGNIPIDKLTVAHGEAMFTAVEARNRNIHPARRSTDPAVRATVRGQGTVSAASMHRIRATLRKALNDAIRTRRLIEFNPAAHLDLPSGGRPPRSDHRCRRQAGRHHRGARGG
jgi:hypothetical protein